MLKVNNNHSNEKLQAQNQTEGVLYGELTGEKM